MRTRFEEVGLANVRVDAGGNVIGELPGRAARPNLVLSAHLDTVFPEGTDVTVSREGAVLKGPGIGDDCRGLAVLLAVATLLPQAGIDTPGTITFVATVGEEGLGDLRGVKHLFNEELRGRIDRFVSVDGAGSADITNVAVGSRRYRITFKGPGGHSYGAFGLASPINALGRAIAAFADTRVPPRPKTTFNVGRVGGGTSVNSIAFEAWMEVDMRSSDPAALKDLETRFLLAVDDALAREHERWGSEEPLTVLKELVGHRPPGSTSADSPIVVAARSVSRALGLASRLTEGSTDSNVPIDLGIPAITVDGGGRGKGAHSLGETFDSTDSWKGTQWVALLALALAQP
jgi:acetylornithine deacetylase/succinyl-diaminopimelate desuccinylase-like protein